MPEHEHPDQPEDLEQLLEESSRKHEELRARLKRMGEEIREDTRKMRAAIARYDVRNARR